MPTINHYSTFIKTQYSDLETYMKHNRGKALVEASYYLSAEAIEMAKKLGMNLRMLARQAHHPVQGKTFSELIHRLYEKRFPRTLWVIGNSKGIS